jgi:hypothetical protein
VTDLKPPRLPGGERETLSVLLQYQRESIVRKVAGVDEDDGRRRFLGSETSLLWLLKHLARAERMWIVRRFAGQDVRLPDDEVGDSDTIASAITSYRSTWATVDAIVAESSLDDLCHDVGDESMVNLRWVLTHLLEETARHAGHADIIREMIDGATGR